MTVAADLQVLLVEDSVVICNLIANIISNGGVLRQRRFEADATRPSTAATST
jgi:hypothetical protein